MMNSRDSAFCLPHCKIIQDTRPFSRNSSSNQCALGHSSFIALKRRKPLLPKKPESSRCTPTCQFSGNVEDLPMEKVPMDTEALPEYWSRPGLYGIYNASQELQFVAATKNVRDAIAMHIRIIGDPQRLSTVRMITVDHVDQAPLGMLAENWVMAHIEYGPGVPPGNSDLEPEWRATDEKPENIFFTPGLMKDMIPGEIRKILRRNRIVLFMKGTRREPKCGFSKSVVEILEETGEDFVCVDCLDEIRNQGLREEIKTYSKWPTIPQLYFNGDFVGGADIVKSMYESGELQQLLKGEKTKTPAK